jgi:hypothetical protein
MWDSFIVIAYASRRLRLLVNVCTLLFTRHIICIPAKNVYLRVFIVRKAKPEGTNEHLQLYLCALYVIIDMICKEEHFV